jgi:hypothetical protein
MKFSDVLTESELAELTRRDFLKGAGAGVAGVALAKTFSDTDGCEKYASKFSCDYVENKAQFDVYLWIPKWIAEALKIQGYDTDQDFIEVLVDRTVGLKSVRDSAIQKYRQILDLASSKLRGWDDSRWPWKERGYIGMLKGPGGEREKHRML